MRLLHAPEPAAAKDATPENDPSHLNAALDMVKRAAQAMDAMEDHAQVVQAKAQELAERARYDVRAARQQIASMDSSGCWRARRTPKNSKPGSPKPKSGRARHEWLARFHETINVAFASRPHPPEVAIATG